MIYYLIYFLITFNVFHIAWVFSLKESLTNCFETGNYQHFFKLWNSNIPEKTRKEDLECQKLEFNLHLHFAVFSLVNNTGKLVSCGFKTSC